MTDFNPKIERKMLDDMTLALNEETFRENGSPVAKKLFDSVNEEWCRLSPSEQAATAAQKSDGTAPVIDGHGAFAGLHLLQTVFIVPISCHEKEK
jgi:hypothetical protein